VRRYCSALGILTACLCSALALGQANVNEGLETAFLFVDAVNGSDSNPGTQSKPFKTISKAASVAQSNNQSGIGTRVTINPGTYRESISLKHSTRDTSLPMTFQAATNGTVVVSGGVLYKAWAQYNSNIYSNGWLHQWGTCPQLLGSCPFQASIMMRREMVAVNGAVLTQVMSIGQMQAGTFYVNEQAAQIYVWPPSGTNMGTAAVEIATNPTLLTVQQKSNIVIRGLTFQYANSCRGNAAAQVLGASSNILFDSDTFRWNNGQGLSISNPVTYFTVQNTASQHNGDSGFHEAHTNHGLWKSSNTSYNNWRGAQAGYYACNTSGLHAWGPHNDTIDGLTISFNQTYGVHWDTDNANISGNGLNVTGNLLSGAFLEKDEGPITLSGSYVCNQNSGMAIGGLVLRNSENVSVSSSVLMNNSPSQIIVIGQPGGITVKNWETGVSKNLITQNFTNSSNTIQGNNTGQLLLKDSYLDGADWSSFQNTLSSSKNIWWNAANSKSVFVVPTPHQGTQYSFTGWQGATGEDSTSSFKAPPSGVGNACNLKPAGTDFWLTVDNNALTVKQGNSATFNLTLTPLNFTGTANLILDGVSQAKGLSTALSTKSIIAAGTSALMINAASTMAKGTYSITAIANSGSLTRTVTVLLTVN
jgi:hypothetical protein